MSETDCAAPIRRLRFGILLEMVRGSNPAMGKAYTSTPHVSCAGHALHYVLEDSKRSSVRPSEVEECAVSNTMMTSGGMLVSASSSKVSAIDYRGAQLET